MRYAGFWIRFWACLLDGLILSLITVPLGLLQTSMLEDENFAMYLFLLVCSWIGYWLYIALFTSGGWQATIGKRLMGLRITDLHGNRISFGQATGRHFGQFVSGLLMGVGYVMIGLTEKKQGLHDIMAGTLVLYGKAEENGAIDSSPVIYQTQSNVGNTPRARFSRWILAGFDANGHVVRLVFDKDNTKLDKEGLFIGRDAHECDLYISDSSISRRHARLFRNHGEIWIEDLQSTNGVIVNGHAIIQGQSTALPTNGKISFGDIELSVTNC